METNLEAPLPDPLRSLCMSCRVNQSEQRLTEKLDIYSLAMTYYTMLSAMTYYTMLSSKSPYAGETLQMDRILAGIPPAVDPSWHPGFVEVSTHPCTEPPPPSRLASVM